jgi:hypothetical protein
MDNHTVIINTVRDNSNICWVSVAHAYNPSYSGGRDQKDYSSKSAQANSSQDPITKKKKNHQKGLVE